MKVKSYKTKTNGFIGLECSTERLNGDLQKHCNLEVIKIARALKSPLLLTMDSHFVRPQDKQRQDIILMSTVKPWKFSTSYHLQSPQEAWDNWCRVHGPSKETEETFCEGVENNQAVVDMIETVSYQKQFHMKEPELPIEIQSLDKTRDQKIESYIFTLIAQHGRLPKGDERPQYIARLKEELGVIARNPTINFLPYFLVVHDICQYARDNKIIVNARGSAAGSLLSYLLNISPLDPIKFNLSFARFLSLARIARGKFPDIDLDFGDPERIVNWMKQKHGDAFVRICTTGTMKLKGAIRDVSRAVLDTKNNEKMLALVDEVCKTLPKAQPPNLDSKKYLYGWEDETGNHKGQIDISPELKSFLEKYPEVKDGLDGVLDIPRSLGRHACAFCLSDIPVQELLPTCVIKDEVCTQFTMGPVEKLGLLKMDLLGVNTLNDIKAALGLIQERTGLVIDPYNQDHIPIDDPAVFDDFCAGKTETVFQFNTPISTDLCKRVQPRSIMDLSDITANGRPGTMYALLEDGETTLVDAWVARRNGKQAVTYTHPSLEPVLSSTQGIMFYQESLMECFQACCGFSAERADQIREVIGKKKAEEMDKLLPEIRHELEVRGWTTAKIESFISMCVASASYVFNKSHSAAYAYVGYICAWLKHYYPLEWWTAFLQNAKEDDIKASAHLCKDFVVPPDINDSDIDFYIIDGQRNKIVYPISMIRGVKKAAVSIVANRPFSSLEDFYNRIDRKVVNRGTVGWLIWSGAFDKMCNVKNPMGRNAVYREYLTLKGEKEAKFPTPLTEFEILLMQNRALPLNSANFSDLLHKHTKKRILSYAEALALPPKRNCFLAGVITSVHVHTPKKKDSKTMCFVSIADKSTTVDVTVFSSVYEARKDILKEHSIVIVEATTSVYNGKAGLIAQDLTAYGVPEYEDSENIHNIVS